jgi:predicted Rossmann-fold nucleotide-binding protein
MYERKKQFRKSDAFVVLAGGAGTRDELWEEITAIQYMRHRKFIRAELDFNNLFVVVNHVSEVLPNLLRMI